MNSVVPADRSLLSRLPVWTPGGAELIRPMAGSGATPMQERPRHRHHDARRHRVGLVLAIDRDDAPEETGKLIGQRAGVGALAVEAIGDGEIDLENAELKHVTRHRPVDV